MKQNRSKSQESGYVLLALMLAFTLILIALAAAVPRMAQQIKREKEEELVHRGKDYATAVKRYVHKNGGRYPLSLEQLEDTNHIRFLRKRYKDPMTGEADWRMVHFGEAQVNIPAPPSTLNTSGISGGGSGISGGGGGISGGGSGSSGAGSGSSGGAGGSSGGAGGSSGGAGGASSGTGTMGTLTTSPIGNGQTIGGGQIIGVASVNKGQAIKEFNDKDHYDEWFFVYDLRLEQSGGTGIAVAAPRVGGNTTGAPGPPPAASPTPVPTPPPGPN
jgi:type II secretory pathway pseudopilin PulG